MKVAPDDRPEEVAAYSNFHSSSTWCDEPTKAGPTDEIASYSNFAPKVEMGAADIEMGGCTNELSAYSNFQSSTTACTPNRPAAAPDDGNLVVRGFKFVVGTMPEASRMVEQWPPLCFLDSCLRGLSQVLFLNNPIFGLCVLVAAAVCDCDLLVYGIVGVVASTGGALILGVGDGPVRGGLMGYNGYLTGVAVALSQYAHLQDWNVRCLVAFQVVFVAFCSTVLQIALGRLMVPSLGIPPLTLPFHLASWFWLLAAQSSIYSPNVDATFTPTLVTPTSWANRDRVTMHTGDTIEGMLKGVSQIFLLENSWSGLILILGAAFASPITAGMCLLGSAVGTLTAMGIGVEPVSVYRGLCGYNSAVIASALGGMFLILSKRTVGLTVFASIFGSVLTFTISNSLAPTGMPALTFPAAATIVLFLLLTQSVKAPVGVPLANMTVPEDHLARMALAQLVRSSFPAINGLTGQVETAEQMEEVERVLVPTLLCHAAAGGDYDKVQEMLELGAEATQSDNYKRTPLHLASAGGHHTLVKMLIDQKADLNAKDRLGGTALWDAYREGHFGLCQLLVQQGCSMGKSTREIGKELCSHAANGNTKQISALIQCGCPSSTPDFDSRTALHLAASEGHVEVLSLLLRSEEVDVNYIDRHQNTALDDALRHKNSRAAQILQVAGGTETSTKVKKSLRMMNNNHASARLIVSNGFSVWKQMWLARNGVTTKPVQLQSTTVKSLTVAAKTTKIQANKGNDHEGALDSSTEDATRMLLLCIVVKVPRILSAQDSCLSSVFQPLSLAL